MFIKTELEQGSDKPSFDVIPGILADVSVFKRSKPVIVFSKTK